jgi:folate-binding protein YgfZ
MTAQLFHQITASGALVNLSARAKLQLRGADRVRYLNGQVTNNVLRASGPETVYACVTDVKGRISGDVFIHSAADTLLLDAAVELREPLALRLDRYIVADDVELADVTEDWQIWHAFGGSDTSEALAGALNSNRFGANGFDLWLPTSAATPAFESKPVLSDEDAETWRILQKVPRWPNELNADTFPPEAGLMDRAMDFTKGCYIGQEVLSRIKTTGKMPREMIAFASDGDVNVGNEIHADKVVGKVTSAARHPVTGQTIGLGMVRQGAAAAPLTFSGSRLQLR